MIEERIKNVLSAIGFSALPVDNAEALVNYGLNSLSLALLILTLQQEFSIKIPVLPIDKDRFYSIKSLAVYVNELEQK